MFERRLKWLRSHPELINSPYYAIRKAMIEAEIAKEEEFILDLKIPDMVSMIKSERKRHIRGNQHISR